ncbi:hypothetical protein [Hymenobacter nivis]|uniref:Uncharacterized protein n=1 Tax=Hymenobacter nivis TaxID=1850093 RepID=A0A2Z3GJI7_9BACT|nr:hypothetical protein [Hymenobacter nivis]AWM32451.1 hypothetical protein DDQ68_06390 [Hymenobacter nivis]
MEHHVLLINDKLRQVLVDLESYFSINLNSEVIDKVFKDAEHDQVSYKTYVFYRESHWLFPTWEITGAVEEYEPETLLIESNGGFGKRKKFDEFFSGR